MTAPHPGRVESDAGSLRATVAEIVKNYRIGHLARYSKPHVQRDEHERQTWGADPSDPTGSIVAGGEGAGDVLDWAAHRMEELVKDASSINGELKGLLRGSRRPGAEPTLLGDGEYEDAVRRKRIRDHEEEKARLSAQVRMLSGRLRFLDGEIERLRQEGHRAS